MQNKVRKNSKVAQAPSVKCSAFATSLSEGGSSDSRTIPLSVILSGGEAEVELLRVKRSEQAKACVRRTRGISFKRFVSSCKESYIIWQDSKRPDEIPSSLALLGFGSDRRLAAHSLSKTSTSLRMTDRGACGCSVRLPCVKGAVAVRRLRDCPAITF